MSELVLLGIDTGGTYTDAVVVTDEAVPKVVASAKSLTTHDDLTAGITDAMASAVSGIDPTHVGLVSLSTTLATNAIVEGQGGPVCLITMGFSPEDLRRGGVIDALGDGIALPIAGGHTSHGEPLAPLDLAELDRCLDEAMAPTEPSRFAGFAVVGQFAVRNSEHEETVRAHLHRRFDLAVTCSHELSAKLNGPKRAVTSVLNAGLVGLIRDLVDATRTSMVEHGIEAPLMIVRGDGSLISAELAAVRPIETILSGPAASVLGARHLARLAPTTGSASTLRRAIVSDIGGTTTDLAVVTDGDVQIRADGASVGGHDTMVEAVDIHTIGLGGDSEVAIDDRGDVTRLRLGPRRVVPVAVLAAQHPDVVGPALREQMAASTTAHLAGQFAVRRREPSAENTEYERTILDGLTEGPAPLRDLLPTKRHELALDRLVRRGAVSRSAFTPTDAAHVLGLHDDFDISAARDSAALFARIQDRRGAPVAIDATAVSSEVIAELQRRTVDAVLSVAFAADEIDADPGDCVTTAGLDRHRGHVEIDVRLGSPLIGLGASAPTYYTAVAERLGTTAVLSPHAAVANAIGAIVGMVKVRRQSTITRKKNGVYMADGLGFDDLDDAVAATTTSLTEEVRRLAARAGATEVDVATSRVDNVVNISGQDFFVDATMTVVGTGRPRRSATAALG